MCCFCRIITLSCCWEIVIQHPAPGVNYTHIFIRKKLALSKGKIMKLTRAALVDHICKANDMNRKQAVEAVESILEIMKSSLEKGDDVLLSGFGKFKVRDKRPRKGRNPKTGEEMIIGARKVVTFKSSGKLRERVNGD
jgi:integration host factor subunit alpha